MAKTADNIRAYARNKYVLPARKRQSANFSIRAGDVVRGLKLLGRVPAVCSALQSRAFLEQNRLRIVERTGPPSGQSTTVIYTYEFVDPVDSSKANSDPWIELRGALKNVFAGLGGGEAYLRGERENFYADKERS